jgi:hypothetical protein
MIVTLVQNDPPCQAGTALNKLSGSESFNESFVEYYGGEARGDQRLPWVGDGTNKSDSSGRIKLSASWAQLKLLHSSRLDEFNASTAQALSSFLREFADVQLGVTETKVRFPLS